MNKVVGFVTAANSITLFFLFRKVRTLMAKEQDLEQDVADLEAIVVEIAAEIAVLKQNGAQNVTQEQLDGLDSRLKAVAAAFKAAE